MTKLKKGARLACVPCGREVVVDCCGVSEEIIFCCGRPMQKKGKAKAAKKAKKAKKS